MRVVKTCILPLNSHTFLVTICHLKSINFKLRHACDAYYSFKCPNALYLRCRPYCKSIIIVKRYEINTRLHTESISYRITFWDGWTDGTSSHSLCTQSSQPAWHSFLHGLSIIFNSVEIRPFFNFECLGFEYPPSSVVQRMPHEQHTGLLLSQINRHTITSAHSLHYCWFQQCQNCLK